MLRSTTCAAFAIGYALFLCARRLHDTKTSVEKLSWCVAEAGFKQPEIQGLKYDWAGFAGMASSGCAAMHHPWCIHALITNCLCRGVHPCTAPGASMHS